MIDRTGQVWMTSWEDMQHVFLIIHTDLNTRTESDKQRHHVKSLFSSSASGITLETNISLKMLGLWKLGYLSSVLYEQNFKPVWPNMAV